MRLIKSALVKLGQWLSILLLILVGGCASLSRIADMFILW